MRDEDPLLWKNNRKKKQVKNNRMFWFKYSRMRKKMFFFYSHMRMRIVKQHAKIRICKCEFSDHHYLQYRVRHSIFRTTRNCAALDTPSCSETRSIRDFMCITLMVGPSLQSDALKISNAPGLTQEGVRSVAQFLVERSVECRTVLCSAECHLTYGSI